jgi:mono/diheme cytochrome c family protein
MRAQRTRLSRVARTLSAAACVTCVGIMSVLGIVHAQQNNGRTVDRASAQGSAPTQRNDLLQPAALPPLPIGMTIEMIADGDQIFHGAGGCFVCHGLEAQGMPAAGDGITVGLAYIPPTWNAIDSLVTAGMPDAITRSPIAMPARGAKGNLSRDDLRRVAAYVWAISQTRGEPWPGGHDSHDRTSLPQAATGTSNEIQRRLRRPPPAT